MESMLQVSNCYKIQNYACCAVKEYQKILNRSIYLSVGTTSQIEQIDNKNHLPAFHFNFRTREQPQMIADQIEEYLGNLFNRFFFYHWKHVPWLKCFTDFIGFFVKLKDDEKKTVNHLWTSFWSTKSNTYYPQLSYLQLIFIFIWYIFYFNTKTSSRQTSITLWKECIDSIEKFNRTTLTTSSSKIVVVVTHLKVSMYAGTPINVIYQINN